ncbi:hypothetical protein Y032_0053g2350 [Ancylostoma ceylanicum]|nr:hypothetical protein Y032_0053g2350 [Ancylostoma ceylanicum]
MRSDDSLREYREAKAEAKKAVATAKAARYRALYEELDTADGEKKIYRIAKARQRATEDLGHVVQMKDNDGRLLHRLPDILNRWREHYHATCNEEFPHPPMPTVSSVLGPVPLIEEEEVTAALARMKNGKSPGPDNLPSEVWKIAEGAGTRWLSSFFNEMVAEGKLPSSWTTSTTVPIWKGKGDIADCTTYRPIRLLCHTMKIFERILDSRLRDIVEVSRNQCGFVKKCSTTDAIHAVRLLTEKHREKKKTVHLAFLDLEKAFDRVPRELIWLSLRAHGVPEEYVRWTQLLYKDAKSSVRCAAGTSPPFEVCVGVHQGSALSPLLFILCMDTISSDLQSTTPWTLLYADDVMIAASTREELQQKVQAWKDRLEQYGMRLNVKKTEYVECGEQTPGTIFVDDAEVPKASAFKYLGSRISADGSTLVEAEYRANAAWSKWRQVTGVMCDRKVPLKLKSKIYRTVVRPVALYGAECWPTTLKHEQTLHTMEMRMLRWTQGLTRLDRVRNDDVRAMFGVAPIVAKMREARLRWYGHVLRSDDNSVAKSAMNITVEGRRPRGRPKTRWLDRIEEDMRLLKLTDEDAFNRGKWRNHTRNADPCSWEHG